MTSNTPAGTTITTDRASSPASPTPRLVIDRDALARNFHALQEMAGSASVAAVVKADAYGLGAASISQRLLREGCRSFFVATAREGADLRRAIGDDEAEIFVFHGYWPVEAELLRSARLIPVINSLDQLEDFEAGPGGPCAIHFDTGMNRLGLSEDEAEALLADHERIKKLDLRLALSHLASSEEADNPSNRAQLERFAQVAADLPGRRLSLANTGGVLLGGDYHFDLVRPGIGLYGAHPANTPGGPFEPVARVEAPILQLRTMKPGETIGYGGTFTAEKPTAVAVVAMGYADGLMRGIGTQGFGRIGDRRLSFLGRISMDLAALDVSGIEDLSPGDPVVFLGHDLNEIARDAGTIGYELLTRLGSRLTRVYEGRP